MNVDDLLNMTDAQFSNTHKGLKPPPRRFIRCHCSGVHEHKAMTVVMNTPGINVTSPVYYITECSVCERIWTCHYCGNHTVQRWRPPSSYLTCHCHTTHRMKSIEQCWDHE